jgi:hypothetical protein
MNAKHHKITPGFTYIDLTGEAPPEFLECQALLEKATPEAEEEAKATLAELFVELRKTFQINEKDAAGDGA